MKRNVVVLAAILAGLVICAAALIVYSRRTSGVDSPLRGVAPEKVVKIVIRSLNTENVLERAEGRWRITSPVQDQADENVVENLIQVLSDFTAGPPVSENRDKLSTFELGDSSATHVSVFLEGRETPALEMEVGKSALNYKQTFIRFSGRDEVRMASDLPRFYLMRKARDLRRQRLLPIDMQEATMLRIEMGAQTPVHLVRASSTSTWATANAQPAPEAWSTQLVSKVGDLYINDFAASDPGPKVTGLSTPFMKITAGNAGESVVAVLGATLPPNAPNDPPGYYARTEGRDALLIMSGRLIGDLVGLLASGR